MWIHTCIFIIIIVANLVVSPLTRKFPESIEANAPISRCGQPLRAKQLNLQISILFFGVFLANFLFHMKAHLNPLQINLTLGNIVTL